MRKRGREGRREGGRERGRERKREGGKEEGREGKKEEGREIERVQIHLTHSIAFSVHPKRTH